MISCRATNFVGKFSSRISPYRLTFSADSTYKYEYHEGLLYSHSSGRWAIIGKRKIKLRSFYQDLTLPLNGQENISSQPAKDVALNIQIPIPSDVKNYFRCLIYINHRFFVEKTCDSISSVIVPSPVRSVQIKITTDVRTPALDKDTLVSSEYYPKGDYLKSINLSCTYNESFFNYKIFNGDILNFSNGKLKFNNYKLFRNLKYKD